MVVVEAVWIGGFVLALSGMGFLTCCSGGNQRQQQQTTVSNEGDRKRICHECGMENLTDALLCDDCSCNFKPTNSITDE